MSSKTTNAALYSAPVEKMPKMGVEPEVAYQIVKDETYPQTRPQPHGMRMLSELETTM